ncbi:Co/Zn/Cd efflux system component [Sphingomonas trueperi]|uniref:Co/Zn/Cd efflux system component n=1 Tax=Sphingomonas trueperi TaxID=53317 RepID=A0A7X5XXP4_9SPHN|nr:Co/Zn/Cd efflux system component [Sphingomonas trueperi]
MLTASDAAALNHSHDFLGAAHDANARRMQWVVLVTAGMMVGEIAAGYATGSMALLADGFHMATHAGALAVAAGAYAFARRHAASGRFSFGTGKVGDLAGFASALCWGSSLPGSPASPPGGCSSPCMSISARRPGSRCWGCWSISPARCC